MLNIFHVWDILVCGNREQEPTLLHIWCALRVDISEGYFEFMWIINDETLNKVKVVTEKNIIIMKQSH